MSSSEKPPARRRVWRISKSDPKGRYVDDTAPPAESKPPEERHSGWAMSSFELKYGLDISEAEDTVPAELLDKLFNAPRS